MYYVSLFFICISFLPVLPAADLQWPLEIPGLHMAKLPAIGFYNMDGSRAQANKGPVRVKLDLLNKYKEGEAVTLPIITKGFNRDSVLVSMGVAGRYLRLIKVDVEGAKPVEDLATAVQLWKEYLSDQPVDSWTYLQLNEISKLNHYATRVFLRRSAQEWALEQQALEEREEDSSDQASWCSIS